MNNICIIRNSFGDRSAFLRLSLEYQKKIRLSDDLRVFLFLDPHPEHGLDSSFKHIDLEPYTKIVFENHKNRKSWFLATKYIFDYYNYDYVLSIEDDVILSYDYLELCLEIIKDKILENENKVLYMHPGAWEKPTGNINQIVYSGNSSRSILIHKSKFNKIVKYLSDHNVNAVGNDGLLNLITQHTNTKAISPKYNRHAHFGVYGWSSNRIHGSLSGKGIIFEENIDQTCLYDIMKQICFDGSKLSELNNNKNPRYFWDFDPNIQFSKLEYKV